MRFRSLPWITALSILLMALVPALAGAQTEVTGQTAGGAHYKIIVPDGWQPANGLVIWNHGFSFNPPGPVDSNDPLQFGPLAAVQLGEGYAVAASSYSMAGWAVFETHLDNQQMVQAFEAEFGTPDQVLIYGASLGGIVTARDVEEGLIPNVAGAMPICGALAGSRVWDGAIDLRLLYDLLCDNVPGAAIPGGANGLDFPPTFDQNAVIGAVEACFGLLAGPDPQQLARLGQFLALTGLPPEFVFTDMVFATLGLVDLVYDPRKNAGLPAFDNANVDYGDPAVNAGIERVVPDQVTRKKFLGNYTPSGKVGDVKIVSIHTDKDGLVIVENESEYAAAVPPGNLTTGILVEDSPTHCGFTDAETLAAWEILRGWVGGLPQPTVQDLQDMCNFLDDNGLAQGPCRYDPAFMVPDLNDRVRLRDVCVPDANTLCLGEGGRFRARITWEDFIGQTGVGEVAALQTEDTGSFWFFNPENIEMVVKAIDGRQSNGKQWIFFGSLTNVEFEMTVTDTEASLVKVYNNPLHQFASVGDTNPF